MRATNVSMLLLVQYCHESSYVHNLAGWCGIRINVPYSHSMCMCWMLIKNSKKCSGRKLLPWWMACINPSNFLTRLGTQMLPNCGFTTRSIIITLLSLGPECSIISHNWHVIFDVLFVFRVNSTVHDETSAKGVWLFLLCRNLTCIIYISDLRSKAKIHNYEVKSKGYIVASTPNNPATRYWLWQQLTAFSCCTEKFLDHAVLTLKPWPWSGLCTQPVKR